MLRAFFAAGLTLSAFVFLSAPARAETLDAPASASAPGGDGLFPEGGHVTLGASTGVPFVGIGEVGYAFTDRFTLGAIGGITPSVVGAGVRPRLSIYEGGAYRVTLVMPILYYPKTHMSGEEPWFLTNPVLSLERRFGAVRAHAGLGLVAAACADSLFEHDHASSFMGGVWNTVQIGGAWKVARATEVFGDAQLIMRGVRPAGDEWIGGPPVVVALGVTQRF